MTIVVRASGPRGLHLLLIERYDRNGQCPFMIATSSPTELQDWPTCGAVTPGGRLYPMLGLCPSWGLCPLAGAVTTGWGL